jgi:hypothetical protein
MELEIVPSAYKMYLMSDFINDLKNSDSVNRIKDVDGNEYGIRVL